MKMPKIEEIAALRQSFMRAWSRLGVQNVPDFAEIIAGYSEPHRAYHTLDHLFDCLRWLAASRARAEQPFEVELALIYHDIVYDPRRVDNEQRSAELFRAHAVASRLPNPCTERIISLIEGTALHRAQAPDGSLVNDIDLAVLGSLSHRFTRYEAQIREEYSHVDERLFRVGREQILESFLEATSIYSTPFFHQRLEAQARTNLSRSLAALRAAAPEGRA